jgi:hypothetical protein
VVRPVVLDAIARLGVGQSARACGLHERALRRVAFEAHDRVSLRVADRIITCLHSDGPLAWLNDPELRSWYVRADRMPATTPGCLSVASAACGSRPRSPA